MAGDALSKHLSKILPALLQSLGEALDGPKEVKVFYFLVDYEIRAFVNYFIAIS